MADDGEIGDWVRSGTAVEAIGGTGLVNAEVAGALRDAVGSGFFIDRGVSDGTG